MLRRSALLPWWCWCLVRVPHVFVQVQVQVHVDAYKLAMVVKTKSNEFFKLSEQGCLDFVARLSENSTCLYDGPLPSIENDYNPDPMGSVQADLIWRILDEEGIDGLAISAKNGTMLEDVVAAAVSRNIPVVTFDSDAPTSRRHSYVGTNNTFMGLTLAKTAQQLSPHGGTYAIVVADSAENMLERVEGVRWQMKSSSFVWEELHNSPQFYNRDVDRAIEYMESFAQVNPDVIIAVNGGPMWSDNYSPFIQRNRFRNLTIVIGDDFPSQINYLSRGYVSGLVGQMPYEMGYMAAQTLYDLIQGRPKPEVLGTNLITHIQVPLVLPPLVVDNNLLGGYSALGYVLFSLVAVVAGLCLLWTWFNRKLGVVKAAQPVFLIPVVLGVVILAAAILPMSMDDKGLDDLSNRRATWMCMGVPWLSCCGFTICFSALFSKTIRINKIFRSAQSFQRIRVAPADVLGPFCVLFSLNIVVLTCWTVLKPLVYVRVDYEGTDGWNRILGTYGACRSDLLSPFLAPLAVINGGVLVMANWQAYLSRNVKSEFSESKYIAISMISLLQALLTGMPILYVVRDSPQAYYLVLSFMIFVVSMGVLLLVFIPKMMMAESFAQHSERSQRRIILESIRASAPTTHSSSAESTEPRRRIKFRLDTSESVTSCMNDSCSQSHHGENLSGLTHGPMVADSRLVNMNTVSTVIDEEKQLSGELNLEDSNQGSSTNSVD